MCRVRSSDAINITPVRVKLELSDEKFEAQVFFLQMEQYLPLLTQLSEISTLCH
jgi:hypothetical protein